MITLAALCAWLYFVGAGLAFVVLRDQPNGRARWHQRLLDAWHVWGWPLAVPALAVRAIISGSDQ